VAALQEQNGDTAATAITEPAAIEQTTLIHPFQSPGSSSHPGGREHNGITSMLIRLHYPGMFNFFFWVSDASSTTP
jgi:hypothetical protein